MAESGKRRNKFGEMARSAIRSILATVGLFGLVGLVLAGATGYALKDHRLWAGVSAAVALAESLALGFFLGVKRGIARAVIEGIQQFSLGRLVLGQIFSRLMNLPVDGAHGERGSVAAKTLERVPLAQAESLLNQAIASIAPQKEGSGGKEDWMRMRLHNLFASSIRSVTLARFRASAAEHGGVDLSQVQSELEERLDGLLQTKLRSGINLWTAGALIALTVCVALQTWGLLIWRGEPA